MRVMRGRGRTVPRRLAWALALTVPLGGCFSESVTEGLPCTSDEHCGRGQVCDLASASCVFGASGETGGGTTDLPPVETCNTDGAFRCAPMGIEIQQCDRGVWTPISCDDACPGGKAGACVDDGSGATCLCADGVGGSCEGFVPDTCTEGGQLEFCLENQVFRNDCSTDCDNAGYPVAGPCVDPNMNGAYCVCADNQAGSCSLSQEFVESCEGPTTAAICVGGTMWETDCLAECTRLGQPGGACVMGRCTCV